MPHLEEQFPLVNPLLLQRPDALEPPEREEDQEARRAENQDEPPRPGSLADGIDRVTLSANARVIVPVQPTEETVPVPNELIARVQLDTPAPDATDEDTGLREFTNGIVENRVSNEAANRTDPTPAEQPIAPVSAPATPPTPSTDRETSRIENRVAAEPATNIERNEDVSLQNARLTPPAPLARSVLSDQFESGDTLEPAEDLPPENPLGLRGDNPVPLDRSVNILTPSNVGEDPPGPNIEEARNFGQGRTLTLNPDTAADERNVIAQNTVDEFLEEAGAIPGPETNEESPVELLSAPAVQPGFAPEPDLLETIEPEPEIPGGDLPGPVLAEPPGQNLQGDPEDIPGPAGANVAVSSLTDTRQVFEQDQETRELQTPAFPELDPDEPFVADAEPEAREEDVPAVAQPPLNVPPLEFENAVPVAPPVPGNVEFLDENPQALRRNNLGTDPALRSNRALRNFLEEFNNRIEPPEAVTESEGGPVTEVQSNAPPPPQVFENLEILREEFLNNLRAEEAREGVTRPEEERTAPPEPRTPETLLTERGQNIDRFI